MGDRTKGGERAYSGGDSGAVNTAATLPARAGGEAAVGLSFIPQPHGGALLSGGKLSARSPEAVMLKMVKQPEAATVVPITIEVVSGGPIIPYTPDEE